MSQAFLIEDPSDGYSDGETSEDLATSHQVVEKDQQPSINDFLSMIDPKICEKSTFTNLNPLSDQDFQISTHDKPFLSKSPSGIDPTKNVVLVTARPNMFPIEKSEYFSNKPSIIAWTDIKQTQISELPTSIQSFYRPHYYNLRNQVTMNYIISPTPEKLDSVFEKKEDTKSRQMFHFVGYGFPDITSKGIVLSSGNDHHEYPYSRFFSLSSPPSCFIFDCNNAGVAISELNRSFDELIKSKKEASEYFNIKDWFCLCATDIDEQLPINPHLPHDFFSSCLLSPVPLAILCHILQYFQTSFPDPKFPMNELNRILLFDKTDYQSDLDKMLFAITDAIVSDFLQSGVFRRVFRRDRMLSKLFQCYVLSQYLLFPYHVHPQSYPHIPSQANHHLWQHWQSELSIWISDHLKPKLHLGSNFFSRVVQSFKYMINSDNTRVPFHILTLMCHAPFSNSDLSNEALHYLSKFSSLSHENRSSLTKVVIFNSFFSKLLDEQTPEIFHSISYIVLCLLHSEPGFVYEYRNDLDVSQLPYRLFNRSLLCETRSLVAAILSCVFGLPQYEAVCCTASYIKQLCNEMSFVNAQLLLWILIFIKKIFHGIPADSSLYFSTGVHIQIAAILFHKSFECRAAAISALIPFINDKHHIVTVELFLIVSSRILDMSFVVRYQYVQFLEKIFGYFLSLNLDFPSPPTELPYTIDDIMYLLFKTKFTYVVLTCDFSKIARLAEEVALSQSNNEYIAYVFVTLCSLLLRDPHPSIKSSIQCLYNKIPFSTKNYDSDMIYDSFDSDALLNISLRQLIKTGQWSTDIEEKSISPFHIQQSRFTQVSGCVIQRFSQIKTPSYYPKKLTFEPTTHSMIIASDLDLLIRIEASGTPFGKTSWIGDPVSDLKVVQWNGDNIVILSTCDGSIHLWNPNHHDFFSLFQSTIPNNKCIINQIAVPSMFSMQIASTNYCGVSLWDVQSQMLIAEWSNSINPITALHSAIFDEHILAVGYQNGSIELLDTRLASPIVISTIPQTNGPILEFAPCYYSPSVIQYATKSGVISTWDSNKGSINSQIKLGYEIDSCSFSSTYPIFIVSRSDHKPNIFNLHGDIIGQFPETEQCSIIAMHPILPLFAVSSKNSDINTYQIGIKIH